MTARAPGLGLAAAIGVALGGTAHAAAIAVQVFDASGVALADAAVYAVPLAGKPPLRPAKASIDQVRREFTPLVSVVPTGTVVSFPNSDNIRHQVYSFSPAKTFELRLYSGTQAPPVVFDKPGIVTLGCNIHDHMIAYVVVVDTPWHGRSDAAGSVRLADLPNGDYALHAWHPRLSGAEARVQPLSVKGDGSVTVRLDLRAGAAKPAHH